MKILVKISGAKVTSKTPRDQRKPKLM